MSSSLRNVRIRTLYPAYQWPRPTSVLFAAGKLIDSRVVRIIFQTKIEIMKGILVAAYNIIMLDHHSRSLLLHNRLKADRSAELFLQKSQRVPYKNAVRQ